MGNQSSRIIWGITTLPGGNSKTPVELYNSSDVVYISGNYAIYSLYSSTYTLFLCTAAETGGTFNTEDWKEQKGVKMWTPGVYKVNARVMHEVHNEEYEYIDDEGQIQSIILDGVYLFKCITQTPAPTSSDHSFHPECWEVVFQEVPLAYIVRDHKDVYYDDGNNAYKWHYMMYYIPPEGLSESDLEVGLFDEEWLYHFDDMCIYKIPTAEDYSLYRFKKTMPTSGPFNIVDWEIVENTTAGVTKPVESYKTYTEYDTGNMVIKLGITVHYQVISPYNGYELKYSISKYCLAPIDPDDYIRREIAAGERLFPNWYRDKIIAGEEIYGLFRAIHVAGNGDYEFNPYYWELINYRDGHYVMQWIPLNNGDPYVVGDERIYFYADPANNNEPSSIVGLCRCIKDHITPTLLNCPTNPEYWEPVTQYIDNRDNYKVYKALRHISAENNSHFESKNWAIVTQHMLIDDEYEDYGIIWEKYGVPGDDGVPYYSPILAEGKPQNVWDSYYHRYTRLDFFYYSTNGQILINGPVLYDTYNNGEYTGNYKLALIGCGVYIYGIYQLFNKSILVGQFNEWKNHDNVIVPDNGGFMCCYQNGFLYKSSVGIGKFIANMSMCQDGGYIYTNDGNEEYYIAYQLLVSGFIPFKYRLNSDYYNLKVINSNGDVDILETESYDNEVTYTFLSNQNGTTFYVLKQIGTDNVTTAGQNIYTHSKHDVISLIIDNGFTINNYVLFDISYTYTDSDSRPSIGSAFSLTPIWLDKNYLFFSLEASGSYTPTTYNNYYKFNLVEHSLLTTPLKMVFNVPYYGGTAFKLNGITYDEVEIIISGILSSDIPSQMPGVYRINAIADTFIHKAYCGSGGGITEPRGIFGDIMETDQRRGDAYGWNVAIPYFPYITNNIGCFAWMSGHNIAGDGPFYGGPDNPEFNREWGW